MFLKEIFEKVNFEKVSRQEQKHEKLPIMQSVKVSITSAAVKKFCWFFIDFWRKCGLTFHLNSLLASLA